MDFVSHTVARQVLNAGQGLFNTVTIPPGEDILRLDRPFAYVLDSPNLQATCANCLRNPSKNTDPVLQKEKLKRCMGCKVVKYCSTNCQRESFKFGHRYECKVYSALYPNVLPNTVRLVLNLVLRRQNQSLGDEEWSAFLALQSHITDFQAQQTRNEDGLTVWQTIELMGQAIAKYSGTKEPMTSIQQMVARILINSHTLTSPTLDPLGLCLSPQSALLNHSCTPNTHIVFSGHKLLVRSLATLEAETELTISYVDTTQRTKVRQSELLSRYFFSCACASCNNGITNGIVDDVVDTATKQIEGRAVELQTEAVKLPTQEAALKLQTALKLLQSNPPYRQPHASISHTAFLNAIALSDWPMAVRLALRAYFHVEPIQYPLDWHPVRVVRKWVLLKLIVNIAVMVQQGDDSVQMLSSLNIDWDIVIENLWHEISRGVTLSHGKDNALAEEVTLMGDSMNIRKFEYEEYMGTGWSLSKERSWAQLRKLGDIL